MDLKYKSENHFCEDFFLLDEITYGENVEKRREPRAQSWVTTAFISWEEEENESDEREKRGQEGRRNFWGVRSPRSQRRRGFQERGSRVGSNAAGKLRC